MKTNIAVIGHGFVGKAVAHGFNTPNVNQIIVDPKIGTSIESLLDVDVQATFVCVPTPMGDDGSINASIACETIEWLEKNTTGLIILKSTVTPDLVGQFATMSSRFVYNPEFLTERNALHDFEYPIMHVFGGEYDACQTLKNLYETHSICKPAPTHFMMPIEASLVKYGMNSFLATKVTWFNQYYDLVNAFGGDYETVIRAIGTDDRIGSSHTKVPGPDGKRWFGGACFTKDVSALLSLSKEVPESDLSILQEAMRVNNIGRSEYDLDDREKEQNVNYIV